MNKTSPNVVDIAVVEPSPQIPAEAKLERWAAAALAASAQGAQKASFSLRIISSAEMTELNTQFADKARPTNVLSFPYSTEQDLAEWPEELADMLALDGGDCMRYSIGDIAICTEVVVSEAKAQGKSLDAHWAHMLVHGVLHLRGYDHSNDALAATMESEEIRILESLGFHNPYTPAEDGAQNTA